MSSLKSLQRAVQQFVVQGTSADAYIAQPQAGSGQERLQIYRNAYFLRLIDQLETGFPHVARQLGKRDFGVLVRDYLAEYPSRYYSIYDVGQHLESFMRDATEYSTGLVELAAFDWSMSRLQFVDTGSVMRVTELVALKPLQWEEAMFSLHPAHQFVSCQYVDASLTPSDAQLDAACHFIQWRYQAKLYYQALGEFELVFLHALTKPVSFVSVCDQLARRFEDDDVVSQLSKGLYRFVEAGLLGAVPS